MFLHDLSTDQKSAFLILAKQLIHADSRLTPEEGLLIEVMQRETGSEIPDNAMDYDKSELLKVFDSPKSKISIMLEILGLAYVDREFSDEEIQFVRDLVDAFKITDEELAVYKNWVLRQLALEQEARHFWAEEK